MSLNRGPVARRRHRQRKKEDDQGRDIFLLQNIKHLEWRSRIINRIYQPRTSGYDNSFDNIPHDKQLMTKNSSINWRKSLSERSTVVTNVGDEHIVSSTVSVRRIKRTSLAKDDTIKDVDEIHDVDIEPICHGDADENVSVTQHRTVSVVRVNKRSSMADIDKSNSNITILEKLNSAPAVLTKNVQVNVIQVPKNQRITKQRCHGLSADNVSVNQLDKSSMEMQTVVDRSTMSIITANTKAKRGSGVTVTRVPRKHTTSQPNIS